MILKFIKILIIEDEFNLVDAIRSMLLSVNYGVQDLIILDVMLLYKNGFEMIIKRFNIHNKKEDYQIKIASNFLILLKLFDKFPKSFGRFMK